MSSHPQPTDGVQLSPDEYAIRKRRMETDPWYFSKYICHHGEKGVERMHRPLLYLYTRQAELLIATLDNPRFEGEITAQVRADLRKCGIDWRRADHLPLVKGRLRRINIRMPRGWAKSTYADDGDLWEGTMDPNTTISLGTKADRYAIDRIVAMGKIILSDDYAFWFPDRVPKDPRHEVTEDAIWIGGRTVVKVEATIEGRGITSPWAGRHYRKNRRDDIVGAESGDASMEDAIKHLDQMDALRDVTGWDGEVYIGTITGEMDDHAVLSADPGVMSVVVPIERHPFEVTLENVWTDGVPTMPEWGNEDSAFDRAGIDAIKVRAKTTPSGLLWMLQNFYMVAHKSGLSLFTHSLLERTKFMWRFDNRYGRELIWRPKQGCESTERDTESANFRPQDWFVLDPLKLPRSAKAWAGDQSVSEDGSGDEWSLAYVLLDHEGCFYLIENIADHGYDLMIDSLVPFDQRADRPPRNGLDANATQGMTIDWLKRSPQFRDLARRVYPIRSNGESKDVHIRNWIQARMKSGLFYWNPRLTEWGLEAVKYKPRRADGRKKRNPVDNRLDATWMAMTMPTRPASPEEIETNEASEVLHRHMAMRFEDPVTHVDSRSWVSQVTNWRVA